MKRVSKFKIYIIKMNCHRCLKKVKKFDDIFYVKDGQHPLLLKQFLAKKLVLKLCVFERTIRILQILDRGY